MKGTAFQPRVLQLNLDNINRLPHSKYPDRKKKKNRGMCFSAVLEPTTFCVQGRRPKPNSLGVIFPDFFFLSGYFLCGSRFMLSKFNCNTVGWKTVPFINSLCIGAWDMNFQFLISRSKG